MYYYDSVEGEIYCDGASSGNPGNAGIGIIINRVDGKIVKCSEYIGYETGNVAEYYALIRGLEEAKELGITDVVINSDSLLVVNQVLGIYKIRNKRLYELYQKVMRLLGNFRSYEIVHIRRKFNEEADKLAKLGAKNKN